MKDKDIEKFNIEVGARLKKLRRQGHITQADIARHAHCTTNAVSLMERGKSKIPAHIIMVYSKLLKVSPSEIFGYDDNKDKIHALAEKIDKEIEHILNLSTKPNGDQRP